MFAVDSPETKACRHVIREDQEPLTSEADLLHRKTGTEGIDDGARLENDDVFMIRPPAPTTLRPRFGI